MKISIVTIVFNDATHIKQTIDSVVSQTRRDCIEYIVIDGASTDGTSAIITNHINDIDIYICEPDTGIYNAMNKGLSYASGDYVMFINSGDRFHSNNVVSDIIDRIQSKMPDIAYGDYCEVKGENLSKIIPCRNFSKIWYGPVASHQSMIYSRSLLITNDITYDESYKIAADYKFTAQAIKASHQNSILKLNICISDFDVSGVSSKNQNLGLFEANRVRKEVFNWGKLSIATITIMLFGARYLKHYLRPLYNLIRLS